MITLRFLFIAFLTVAWIRGADAQPELLKSFGDEFKRSPVPAARAPVSTPADSSGQEADLLRKLDHYFRYDAPVEKLLKVNYLQMNETGKKAYLHRLKAALEQYSETSLRTGLMKQIGDLHFELQQYSKMRNWYEQVLQAEPSLKTSTPIGYRMKIGEKFIARRNMLRVFHAVSALLVLILIFRFIRFRTFDRTFFFKGLALSLGGFLLAGFICFWLDGVWVDGRITKNLGVESFRLDIIEPVVPFGLLDMGPAVTAKAFIAGFIPVLFALFLLAAGRFRGRWAPLLLVLVMTAAIWGHFILKNMFGDYFEKQGIFTKTAFYYPGELEVLLVEKPDKVLKAAPALLKSENQDLIKFLEEKHPEWLKNQR